MSIDALKKVMNSPQRILSAEDKNEIHRDLSLLISNPTLKQVWVDGSGHLHQKIRVVNLSTLIAAIIDLIFQAFAGLEIGILEKDAFVLLKLKEIIDLYVPQLLAQEAQCPSADAEKIGRLQSLHVQLSTLKWKMGIASPSYSKRIMEVSSFLDELITHSYFDQIGKTSQVGSTQINGQSVHQKFQQLSPFSLEPIHFTNNHIKMLCRVVSTAPASMRSDLSIHAARHLCALQKGNTDQKLSVAIEVAQAKLSREDLILAAKEFKILPLCFQNNAEVLALILAGLRDRNTDFAREVSHRLYQVSGGKEQAISQLHATFDAAQKLKPKEKIKALKEVLPAAIHLFMKSQDQQVADFIDEIVLCLLELDSAKEVIIAAMSDDLTTEKILGSVLTVYAATGNEVSRELFIEKFHLLLKDKQGMDILAKLTQNQIEALPTNQLAINALSLLQKEVGQALADEVEGSRLVALGAQISAAMKAHAHKIAQENLEGKFTAQFNELLSFETGMNDLEQLIQDKVNQLGRDLKMGGNRSAAESFLRVIYTAITQRVKNAPTALLGRLKKLIEQALEGARLGSALSRLKQTCVTQTMIMELKIKTLSQNLAHHLYKPDGTMAQEPFRRLA